MYLCVLKKGIKALAQNYFVKITLRFLLDAWIRIALPFRIGVTTVRGKVEGVVVQVLEGEGEGER
jgi:hypothetical protein